MDCWRHNHHFSLAHEVQKFAIFIIVCVSDGMSACISSNGTGADLQDSAIRKRNGSGGIGFDKQVSSLPISRYPRERQ